MNPATPFEEVQPLNLPQDVLTNLTNAMSRTATDHCYDWDERVQHAGDQRSRYAALLVDVDNVILDELSRTVQTHEWVPMWTRASSTQFVEKMDNEEFKEWCDRFLRIIKDRDWASRAANRTCLSVDHPLAQLIPPTVRRPGVRRMHWFREIRHASFVLSLSPYTYTLYLC